MVLPLAIVTLLSNARDSSCCRSMTAWCFEHVLAAKWSPWPTRRSLHEYWCCYSHVMVSRVYSSVQHWHTKWRLRVR